MTTLNVNTIKPAGNTLTIGEDGDTVVIADDVKVNTLNDAGGGYKYAVFNAPGAQTWTCPTGVTSVEVLVVAGGGGSSGPNGGGGGAGGIVHNPTYTVVPAVVYDLTVGAGTAAGTGSGTVGPNGGNSTWNDNAEGSGVKYTAIGGGGGSAYGSTPAADGGSGGGGTVAESTAGDSTQQSAGTPTGGTVTAYGNQGGWGPGSATQDGGGGGAGGAGTAGYPKHGGGGGVGVYFANFQPYGAAGWFGGGGGGGAGSAHPDRNGGAGGRGGGGDGGHRDETGDVQSNGLPGTPNTGGGAGGASYVDGNQTGGGGGSGTVILRYQDAAPNPVWVSNGSGVITGVKPGIGGSMKLLSRQVAANQEGVYFLTQITDEYQEYVVKWISLHPVNDGAGGVTLYVSTDGGTNWSNTNITSTFYVGSHAENNSEVEFAMYTSYCQHQGSDGQTIQSNIGNADKECGSGEYHLYNPASTTYVKNFWSVGNAWQSNNYVSNAFCAGYYNTTSAINAIRFRMGSGNIQHGIVKLYGIAT